MTLLYFSYGSNMDAARMLRRCGPTGSRRWAVAEGFRLHFAKRADVPGIDDAGFATLRPDADARTEGVVYEVTAAQLDAMDRHEGAPEHYARHPIGLRLTDGTRIKAVTYLANPARCAENLKPPRFYLYHFHQASDLLSPGWLAWLRSVETADA
jgi:cation transport regulator ChaC